MGTPENGLKTESSEEGLADACDYEGFYECKKCKIFFANRRGEAPAVSLYDQHLIRHALEAIAQMLDLKFSLG
jgi:hypothetical protein